MVDFLMEKIYVKNETLFKNKWQMVVYCFLFVVLIGAFIYFGTLDYDDTLPDNEEFARELQKQLQNMQNNINR